MEGEKSSQAQLLISLIRLEYLGAKPPQQIEEVKELLEKTKEEASSIQQNTNLLFATTHADDGMRDEDLDRLGNKTKEKKHSNSELGSKSCKKRNILGSIQDEEIPLVISSLYEETLGLGGNLQPPIQYRIAFAKYIIKQLESSNQSGPGGHHSKELQGEAETLLETWYDALERLSASDQLTEPFYRLYEIETGGEGEEKKEIVKIFENETQFVSDGTTGLVTWKATIEFLKWLPSSPSTASTKTRLDSGCTKWVLELGCGCGLLAIGVTKVVALEQYIATDGSLAALEKAMANVNANFNGEEKKRIRFEKVEWQNEATNEAFSQLVDGMSRIYGSGSGVLLGADIIFDPELIPDLVKLLGYFLEVKAGRVILSSTIRNQETVERFKDELDSNGLGIIICDTWEDGEILEVNSKNS